MKLVLAFLIAIPALVGQSVDLATKSERAKELMAAGKFEEAVPAYRDLVRAVPSNPGLIMNLGMALHMAGHEQEAIREFRTVLRLQPEHLPARLFLAEANLRLGEPSKAVEPLEKVIELQPDNRQAREMLANALLALGRSEQASKQFRKLSGLEPENPKVWYGLGRTYEALSRHAFAQLQKAAAESGYWLALAADTRLKERQYSSAFYLYRQALSKIPSMHGVHAALAEIYRSTGHENWAATEEEREGQLSQPDCGVQRLECNFRAGRYSEVVSAAGAEPCAESYYWQTRAYNQLALEAFTRLGELPASAELHELKASIYMGQKRYQESAQEWQEALKLEPRDPEIQRQLAVALDLNGEHEAAQPLLQHLLSRQPNSAELNYLFGDTLLNQQQAEPAIPYLKKAIERDPALLGAHRALALAYLQIARPQQAVPHLKAALPIDSDGSLHYQLARAYQTSGQPQLAQQTLRAYQDIRKSLGEENREAEQEAQITPP